MIINIDKLSYVDIDPFDVFMHLRNCRPAHFLSKSPIKIQQVVQDA